MRTGYPWVCAEDKAGFATQQIVTRTTNDPNSQFPSLACLTVIVAVIIEWSPSSIPCRMYSSVISARCDSPPRRRDASEIAVLGFGVWGCLPKPPNYPLIYPKYPLVRAIRHKDSIKGQLGGPGSRACAVSVANVELSVSSVAFRRLKV